MTGAATQTIDGNEELQKSISSLHLVVSEYHGENVRVTALHDRDIQLLNDIST